EGPTPFVRSSSPTPPPANAQHELRRLQYSDLSAALTTSQFHVSASHTFVSPLIGNSMVHIKVVMDGIAVVVPMVRSIVFVHARERILTKLLQGGVPLVETKRRKLVVRKMDGSVAVIEDNPTWRTVMDIVSEAGRPQARTSEGVSDGTHPLPPWPQPEASSAAPTSSAPGGAETAAPTPSSSYCAETEAPVSSAPASAPTSGPTDSGSSCSSGQAMRCATTGTGFQQCVNGSWITTQDCAPGTKCQSDGSGAAYCG
ncbi:hypothetical protein IWW49_005452, partial [Coemansia sp. RSA 1797]